MSLNHGDVLKRRTLVIPHCNCPCLDLEPFGKGRDVRLRVWIWNVYDEDEPYVFSFSPGCGLSKKEETALTNILEHPYAHVNRERLLGIIRTFKEAFPEAHFQTYDDLHSNILQLFFSFRTNTSDVREQLFKAGLNMIALYLPIYQDVNMHAKNICKIFPENFTLNQIRRMNSPFFARELASRVSRCKIKKIFERYDREIPCFSKKPFTRSQWLYLSSAAHTKKKIARRHLNTFSKDASDDGELYYRYHYYGKKRELLPADLVMCFPEDSILSPKDIEYFDRVLDKVLYLSQHEDRLDKGIRKAAKTLDHLEGYCDKHYKIHFVNSIRELIRAALMFRNCAVDHAIRIASGEGDYSIGLLYDNNVPIVMFDIEDGTYIRQILKKYNRNLNLINLKDVEIIDYFSVFMNKYSLEIKY